MSVDRVPLLKSGKAKSERPVSEVLRAARGAHSPSQLIELLAGVINVAPNGNDGRQNRTPNKGPDDADLPFPRRSREYIGTRDKGH